MKTQISWNRNKMINKKTTQKCLPSPFCHRCQEYEQWNPPQSCSAVSPWICQTWSSGPRRSSPHSSPRPRWFWIENRKSPRPPELPTAWFWKKCKRTRICGVSNAWAGSLSLKRTGFPPSRVNNNKDYLLTIYCRNSGHILEKGGLQLM